jgi:hypothetical protein
VSSDARLVQSIEGRLDALAAKWTGVRPAERSNYQLYLSDLCDALGVERPRPAGTGYCFEQPIRVVNRDGTEATNYIDLFKKGHFVLEAKDQARDEPESVLLRGAFGQAKSYAADAEGGPPPYLLVLNVGKSLTLWDRWSGSYGGFNAGRIIALPTLAERPADIALLRDIWENPAARDPRKRSVAVTKEIAARLAELSGSLERRGHSHEEVARFLIRCVFTMFAEDVGLLQDQPFTTALQEIGFSNPPEFRETLAEIWHAMDTGGRFGLRKFLRFNGHFFADQTVLPLEAQDLAILFQASQADWAEVEPSIMGTLLTRALDPGERHRLGAEYTPRAFVERVVRPTVEEPIRERWTAVQAEVLQLRNSGTKNPRTQRENEKLALDRLRGFHEWLRGLQFLDPACGSGNFLYVTLDLVKQIEYEVLRGIEELTGHPELAVEEVGPWQFHGIELKAWARELAELTLWIGYHQWWRRVHGHVQPPEPVLRDTGTLEHRDAVLAWDSIAEDRGRARPDPTPRLRHPVTGELVPDPARSIPYLVHVNSRPAEWPRADFIVGNPPYMGRGRQRDAFGDGYVDALRAAYPDIPENADYVMYWWHRAAEAVAAGHTIRAGLITTNTITQRHNREVIEFAAAKGATVAWAAPDHPWVDEAGAANVRVAMTVIAVRTGSARLVRAGTDGVEFSETVAARLNSDLTVHADVSRAAGEPLRANRGLSSQGFTLVGEGFRLNPDEGQRLAEHPEHAGVVKQIMNGRDLTTRPRGIYTIDFALMSEEAARSYPVLYDLVRDRVLPARAANKRESYARYWWRFGETRSGLRSALEGLPRYIVTVETAKHRVFQFMPSQVATEHSVICIAMADGFSLGVLSSRLHVTWALAAGGRLGVGNDPRYQKALCFDPFPFPAASSEARRVISDTAERIERHRRGALERDGRVTITGMYNVVEKLRAGGPLTDSERVIHEAAACGVLRDLHAELDRYVFLAYGWPDDLSSDEVLSRLVALHDERIAEERSGQVRWLRAEYQALRFGRAGEEGELDLMDVTAVSPNEKQEWPAGVLEQIGALQELLRSGAVSAEEATRCFGGARLPHVLRHLETLELLGEARRDANGAFHAVSRAAA